MISSNTKRGACECCLRIRRFTGLWKWLVCEECFFRLTREVSKLVRSRQRRLGVVVKSKCGCGARLARADRVAGIPFCGACQDGIRGNGE